MKTFCWRHRLVITLLFLVTIAHSGAAQGHINSSAPVRIAQIQLARANADSPTTGSGLSEADLKKRRDLIRRIQTSSRDRREELKRLRDQAVIKAKDIATSRTFDSREDAMAEFRKNFSGLYPSTFRTQPENRPGYIPKDIEVDGTVYSLTYSPEHQSYGYETRAGNWVKYEVFQDTEQMNKLLTARKYFYEGMAGHPAKEQPPETANTLMAMLYVFGFIVLLLALAITLSTILKSKKTKDS